MTITLHNGTIYTVISANYGETQINGVKTYTVIMYADTIGDLETTLVEGDFEIDNEGYTQSILNMRKISRYTVNPDRGTIQFWLEEISETEEKLQELDALKTKFNTEKTVNEATNQDIMLAITELYEMVLSTESIDLTDTTGTTGDTGETNA